MPTCDDQVETRELPRNTTTKQVNSKVKIHEERNKIIKKKEERRIIRPKKTRVTKELIEMTRSEMCIRDRIYRVYTHSYITNTQ